MDSCIRTGVTSTESTLPGGLDVRRRAPGLYRRLQKGFYPTVEVDENKQAGEQGQAGQAEDGGEKGLTKRLGRRDHVLGLAPVRTTPVFPGIEYLSCMAIAVSRLGGRAR
jgi:hypothetical protein